MPANPVGVGEVEARFDPDDHDAGRDLVLGMLLDVGVLPSGSGYLAELGDAAARRAVQQQHEGRRYPDEQSRERVEHGHPEQCRDRRDEGRTRRHPVRPPQPPVVDPIQPHQRGEVDKLHYGRDHHRRERRLGQLLEQSREQHAA